MKASELIAELQMLMAAHGDLEVKVYDHDEQQPYPFGFIEHTTDDDDDEPSFEICHIGYGS